LKKIAVTKILAVTLFLFWVCTLYSPPADAAWAGNIVDDFNAPSLNTRLWRTFQDDQAQWVQQGGELRITIVAGADNRCVQVESKFSLKGDFEMKVDYRLITWPPANGARLGFEGPGFSGADYAQCMVKRISRGADEQPNPSKEVFMASFKEGSEWTAEDVVTLNTTDEYGSLKLIRAGNRMTGSFSKDGGLWQEITSRDYSTPTGLPEWYAVTLSVCGRPSTNVEIAFDNFQVSYDQVSFISDLSPVTLLLLD
jgi:hypothetical protein